MKVIVTLKDSVTGDTKDYVDKAGYSDYNHLRYMWVDGNYSCDCNRSLFLWKNKSKHLVCSGKKNRIIVTKIIDKNTKEILLEDV